MDSSNKSENTGVIWVIIAGISWGIISIFINHLSGKGFDSLQISCIRAWFSVLLLSVFFLIKNKELFMISIKDIWMFVGTGILSLTFFSYCYFSTIVAAGAAIAVVLLYTSPVFVMIMSAIVFKEKITGKKIVGLLLTISGCILVAGLMGTGGGLNFKTFAVGLGAGFGYALYSIFAGFATKKYSSLTITFYTLLFSGISLLFICKPMEMIEKTDSSEILWFFGIALLCTVIPYITYTYGLSKMEAGKAAVLVTVEPLVGCLFGIFVWKEEFTLFKGIGILLIFSAVILLSLKDSIGKRNS